MLRLVVSDGNPGLLRAVGEVWPEVAIQRCIAHRIRNILDRVPKAYRESVKKSLREIFYADDEKSGRKMAEAFVEKWEKLFGSATKCLLDQLDACLTFYRFPTEHWKRIRTSNVLERTFKEARRRTNVVERFPTEESALALIWSVLVEQTTNWRGVETKDSQVIHIAEAVKSIPKSMLAVNNMGTTENELAA
jgi:putative transposase